MTNDAELLDLALAVVRGSKVKVKDKYWANGMYHDAEVCAFCGHYDTYYEKQRPHDKECPVNRAKKIVKRLLE